MANDSAPVATKDATAHFSQPQGPGGAPVRQQIPRSVTASKASDAGRSPLVTQDLGDEQEILQALMQQAVQRAWLAQQESGSHGRLLQARNAYD